MHIEQVAYCTLDKIMALKIVDGMVPQFWLLRSLLIFS